ncbi:MAG: UDP-3-O-(3-hydroxymyristoyl)glucosamine N-acyltransferase [Syntrophorhabdaceae bacterium]|nr:UDP-3-O-(3-hydroxymyristoyl)glucosamine N-acyltransferase [Syntrophorhabdaceae bacterium]
MITLGKIADTIQGELIGDGSLNIKGVSGIEDAEEGDITFLINKGYLRYLKDSKASAFIIGNEIGPGDIPGKALVISKNPSIDFIKVVQLFEEKIDHERGINPLAYVSKGAYVSPYASILPFAYVGDGAHIEKGVIIHPYAFIGNRVKIGEDSTIYPHVTIYDGVSIGKKVTIHSGSVIGSDGFGYVWDGKKHRKIPQIGTVIIEDDVEIGANVTIDRATLGKTTIRKGTKIDNLVQIAHNVTVGENSIIVSQTGIAGSVRIGKGVILAGQVGVRDHVTIGDNVKAAGGTGITKDVPANSSISGTPHMDHREWLRLQTYIKRLPKLYDTVKRIEMKLKMEDKNNG